MRHVLFLVILLFAPWAAAKDCAPSHVDIQSESGVIRFSVALADTPERRQRGLMFVKSMPRFNGMLFVFDAPHRASFWMKNTYIPLDLLFVDKTGQVLTIAENAVPHSEATIDGGEGVSAVLEINGGLAEMLGLAPGDKLRHPAFDQEIAAWPCAAP